MRLAAFSDSHGDEPTLRWAMEQVGRMGKIDAFIFLGDGALDFRACQGLMARLNPLALTFQVRGNNDFFPEDLPMELTHSFHDVKVLMTHGHRYQAKLTHQGLLRAARERGCRVCLYGHTHTPFLEEREGILLMNPGALAFGRGESVGLLDIGPQGQLTPRLIPL